MTKNWMSDLVGASPAARYIAWSGEISFAGATETDSVGRTVSLILCRPPEELSSAHPFAAATRRRRGHAGTLYTMSIAAFDGETPATKDGLFSVMLLNWGSGPKGDTVKFLLNFEAATHPFLGCTRAARDQKPTRWMATFLEEDDASAPVDQKQRASVEQAAIPRKPKQQIKNSNLAAQFTKNRDFWTFMGDWADATIHSQRDADAALKSYCMIDSKSALDSDPTAAAEFNSLRQEFVAWQQRNGIDTAQ